MVHIPDNQAHSTVDNQLEKFKMDILSGLSKSIKQIPSKYFYDEYGCNLFNKITRHPSYYLTRCELEILNKYKAQLSNLLHKDNFNLIELGPGEGIKTLILIEQFLHDALIFNYSPIDISVKYLTELDKQLHRKLPALKLTSIHAEYVHGLEWLSVSSKQRNFVLFLGSSIGNFDHAATEVFLKQLWQALHHGDYILIGFDLRKDIEILINAYNDRAGITRDFNLNLMERINRELGADFSIDKFSHYATYNVYIGAMESYLISREQQTVTIEALKNSFTFQPFEPIHVECSHKYLLSQIQQLADISGFQIVKNFADSQYYFIDSLWQVKKN